MKLADYGCRTILRLYPPAFRDERAGEMRATFLLACAAASRRGRLSAVLATVAELFDLLLGVFRSRQDWPPLPDGQRKAPAKGRGTGGAMNSFRSDMHQAFRALAARPGTTALAVSLLALAIAACTTVFTVADAVIFKPLPYKDADRLVPIGISRRPEAWPSLQSPLPLLRAWRDSGIFERVEAHYSLSGTTIDDGSEPQTVSVSWITPGMLDLLSVVPIRGRGFTLDDARQFDPPALLSERLWRSQFGGREDIVGQRISVAGRSTEIVGVMSRDFRFPWGREGLWRPVDPDIGLPPRKELAPVAKLRAGMPREEARRRAEEAARALNPSLVAAPAAVAFAPAFGVRSFDRYTVNVVRLLFAGVLLVLLVACVNVANLLLARALGRRRERAVRTALGASRGRLVHQALLESGLIAAAAAAAGLALSWAAVSSFETLLPEYVMQRGANGMNVDGRALGLVIGLAVIATLASGVLPAWLGTRATASSVLKEGDRGASEGRLARRLSSALIVGEVAVAVALLVGAALMVRSFLALARAERGIDTSNVVTVSVRLPLYQEAAVDRQTALAAELQRRLGAIPGVEHVMRVWSTPPDNADIYFSTVETDAGAKIEGLEIFGFHVRPEFFNFFGMQLAAGRFLSADDPPDAVVISENLARSLWPDASSVVGRTFRIGTSNTRQVVGVSRDMRTALLDPRVDLPEVFQPAGRFEPAAPPRYVLKLSDGAAPPHDVIRAVIRSVHPKYLIHEVASLDEQYREQIEGPELAASIAAAFAGFGMLVCAAGLFSVLSLSVARRRREFGIRLAIGARPSQLSRLVARQTVLTLGSGIALGCVTTFALTRSLSSVLAGVERTDAISWLSVLIIVVLAGAAAAWLPLRDARRTDPLLLLREE